MNQKKLWIKIINNDKRAFNTLFERLYNPLCSYVYQLTSDMDWAKDIVQEVFIKLWNKRDTIIIRTSLKSFMFKMAYYLFLEEKRICKREKLFLDDLKYEALVNQIEEEEEEEEEIKNNKINRINELIERLPVKCKEIVLLSKRDKLKNKEIAVKLKISIKTVENQISIAFKKIREEY